MKEERIAREPGRRVSFSDADCGPASAGFGLVVSRQARLEIRRRVPRRGQYRDSRPWLGGQSHNEPPDHGLARNPKLRKRPRQLLRPNLVRNPSLPSGERTVERWFDTSAFAAPPFFSFGNSPRSVLRGAALLTMDVTLERSFTITERWAFNLRGEFFNLLNHGNFNLPGFTLGTADFGVVSTARPGRTMQLGARLSF